MKTKSNKIKDIENYALSELKNKYPHNEIQSFINILFNSYAGINSAHLKAFPEETVNESSLLNIVLAVQRLKKYEPIQYILGYTEFSGLKIKVTPDVLIPRPETEELVYKILSDIRQNTSDFGQKTLDIIDLCTGSGCIALALNKYIENSCVKGVDISDKALEIAKENNKNLNLNVNFCKYDVLNPQESETKYDIIVSNPPYVTQKEKIIMEKNVLDYEPSLALFVKDDNPLVFYEKIAVFAHKNLKKNGKIYLETNSALTESTFALFSQQEYIARIEKDIFNKDRFIFLQKTV